MTEDEILYKFVKSGVIKGQFVRQFPIGIRRLTDKYRGTAKDEGGIQDSDAGKIAVGLNFNNGTHRLTPD